MTTIFILNDTRPDRHHGCSIVMGNLLAALARSGAKVSGTLASGHYLDDDPALVMACQQADRIIINGEGTLHHDRPYARYLLTLGAEAVQRRQAVYLINASWEANSPALAELLQGYAGIWVRDSGSAAELQSANVAATVAPDLTFQSSYAAAPAIEGSPVVVTDSVFASTSDMLFELAKRHGWEYVPIIQAPSWSGQNADRAKYIKASAYHALTWLSFGRYRPRRYYQDLRYCRSDTTDFLAWLAGTRAVVTGRYHAVCLALQHRIPFVCLSSNTRKVEQLLRDAGLDVDRHLLSSDELGLLSAEQVLQRAVYTLDELARLEVFLSDGRECGQRMLHEVCVNG